MTMLNRLALCFFALVTLCVAAPDRAFAQSKSVQAAVKVNIRKPLVLEALQPLEFGTIVLSDTATSRTVSISQAGVLSCPAQFTCTGTAQPAMYNINGSHKLLVDVSVPAFDLVNPLSGAAIRFYPDAPRVIELPNSGNRGVEFSVGGSITVPTTAEGVYEGTMTVTADYQ